MAPNLKLLPDSQRNEKSQLWSHSEGSSLYPPSTVTSAEKNSLMYTQANLGSEHKLPWKMYS